MDTGLTNYNLDSNPNATVKNTNIRISRGSPFEWISNSAGTAGSAGSDARLGESLGTSNADCRGASTPTRQLGNDDRHRYNPVQYRKIYIPANNITREYFECILCAESESLSRCSDGFLACHAVAQ
jgi:hypothetical protein